MDENALRKDLECIAGRRIFFGHQSVGADIMQGVRELSDGMPGSHLNLRRIADSAGFRGPYFVDAMIGRNSDPASKCAAFSDDVDRLSKDSLDVAVMKFCYVDMKPETDVGEMFRTYERTIGELKGRHPGVTFVHVTVPLTERSVWWKRLIKKVIGRTDTGEIGNGKRSEFNGMLLERFKGEPVFDLARIESTFPDGTRNSFEYGGRTSYCLVSAYTRDGGHLNDTGRKIVAGEFVQMLSDVIRREGK